MRTLFLLNPAAGKQDCTASLIPQIEAAARRAGLEEGEYTVCVTEYAGHARELAHAAAQETAQSGEPLRIYTAGGDGTFNGGHDRRAMGFAHAAVGCLPYGSGNDFLRTYGTKEEFADLDAQLAGGEVTIDLLETNLGLSATICAAGLDAQVAYGIPKFRRIPLVRRRGGLPALHRGAALRPHRPEAELHHRRRGADGGLPDVRHLQRPKPTAAVSLPRRRPVPDDGWLDVFIVRKVGRLTIAKLLGMYKNGRHFARMAS